MTRAELVAWVGIAIMSAALVGLLAYILRPLFTRAPADLEGDTRPLRVPPRVQPRVQPRVPPAPGQHRAGPRHRGEA